MSDNNETPPEAETPELNDVTRHGDTGKCPACGSAVDPEAYHCPTCGVDFCFHCRARLLPPDTTLQCVNQACDYYGKPVCDVCNPSREHDEAPAIYAEPVDGYWPALTIGAIVLGLLAWYAFGWFYLGLFVGVASFAASAYFLHQAGVDVFGTEHTVEQPRRGSKRHCLRCDGPVKELRHAQ
ncbi:hypothetical protein MalM25_16080 [Planctomycetes bacterium MalM25]|nr:hypothetical protein MalM25_16080 [Planctomycetes bacterium MalM25]